MKANILNIKENHKYRLLNSVTLIVIYYMYKFQSM